MKKSLNMKGHLLDLSTPLVMAILNRTPDSFFGKSRVGESEEILLQTAEGFRQEGAAILDIGGYSTRPGAAEVSIQEETDRVLPAIESIKRQWPGQLVSVDTFRAEVAAAAVTAGADIINDVSGGTLDSQMFDTVAQLQVPYILMHMRGTPQTMHQYASYQDIALEVLAELQQQVAHLQQKGVRDIIIDPGFGFAKTIDQNYELLRKLHYLHLLECPLLVGVSRKSMIWKLFNITPEEALPATSALNLFALQQGAAILRVHDVAEARRVTELASRLF